MAVFSVDSIMKLKSKEKGVVLNTFRNKSNKPMFIFELELQNLTVIR